MAHDEARGQSRVRPDANLREIKRRRAVCTRDEHGNQPDARVHRAETSAATASSATAPATPAAGAARATTVTGTPAAAGGRSVQPRRRLRGLELALIFARTAIPAAVSAASPRMARAMPFAWRRSCRRQSNAA